MPWWQDKLPAQLASVRFHVDRTSKRGGRRSTAHEFPGVDEAYVEDTGAAPHRYRVEAFLVGPEYHVRLQELEEVLDGPGPLEYHHPDRGIIPGLWLEGTYETQHHKNRQGYATCSFTLVQNGPPIPLIFDEPAGRVRAAAAMVLTRSAETFEDAWSGSDPFSLAANALARVNDKMMSAYTKVTGALGPINDLRREIKEFHRNAATMKSMPGAYAGAFQALGRVFMSSLTNRLRTLTRDRWDWRSPTRELMGAVDELRSFTAGPEAEAEYRSLVVVGAGGQRTAKALAAKRDLDALAVLVDATVLAAVAESLTELELPTANAAVELGQALALAFDEVLAAELGDEPISSQLHDAILELRVQTLEYLSDAGGTLPVVETIDVPAEVEVPLALVAYWRAGGGAEYFAVLEQVLGANPELEDPLTVPPSSQLKVVML